MEKEGKEGVGSVRAQRMKYDTLEPGKTGEIS